MFQETGLYDHAKITFNRDQKFKSHRSIMKFSQYINKIIFHIDLICPIIV